MCSRMQKQKIAVNRFWHYEAKTHESVLGESHRIIFSCEPETVVGRHHVPHQKPCGLWCLQSVSRVSPGPWVRDARCLPSAGSVARGVSRMFPECPPGPLVFPECPQSPGSETPPPPDPHLPTLPPDPRANSCLVAAWGHRPCIIIKFVFEVWP